ncbi:hypothetical protein V6K52_13475 [Knoellia sp. S7-12]|uniref:hypothetical protein n=1 Tax=Knoellia sp. S7-12 TaxID=3126698 RepID=UPI003368F3B6
MTSQPPPAIQPHLVDLRREHERTQKRFRTARLVVLSVVVVFGLFMGLVAFAVNQGVARVAYGLLFFFGFVMVFVVLMVVSGLLERRHPGPAGNGPSSLGQVVTSAPGPQVWEAVNSALRDLKFATGRPIDPQTVVSTRSISMASWGEILTIRIVGTADGRGLVTVWSRPAVPLQWLDYGRNRRYANAVLGAIPGATPVA